MGVLNAQPKLNPEETIRWKTLANRVVGPRATSGGQLIVTNNRIFFQPNRFDTVTGRKPWECPLDTVTGIDAVSRDGAVLAGGMRERLGVQTVDGTEIFVVNDLTTKMEDLRELLLGT